MRPESLEAACRPLLGKGWGKGCCVCASAPLH